MVSKKYTVLFFMCLIYILSFFHRVCPTIIASDLTKDLGLNLTDLTLISSATMLTYGFMQLPSGILADAFGAKKTIVYMSILTGASSLLFAIAGSVNTAVFARLITGLGLAVTVPAMALLAICFSKESFARANSILLCCGGIGGILAAPPLLFMSEVMGWRWSIACFGIFTLAVAMLIHFAVPDFHEKKQAKPNMKTLWQNLVTIASTKAFWPLILWQVCMFSSSFALSSLWWGPYLIEGNNFSHQQVSVILTIASVTLMFSQPLMATFSDLYFKARKKPLIFLSLMGLLASLVWVFFTGKISFTLMAIQTVLFMIALASGAPLSFTMTKEMFPPHLTGTAIGFLNMFFPIWIGVNQMMYGKVLEWQYTLGAEPQHAFSMASLVIVVHIFIGCICTFFMKETYSK